MTKQYEYFMKTGHLDMMLPVPSTEMVLQWVEERMQRIFG